MSLAMEHLPPPLDPRIDPACEELRDQANQYQEDLLVLDEEQMAWLERFNCAVQLSDWGLP